MMKKFIHMFFFVSLYLLCSCHNESKETKIDNIDNTSVNNQQVVNERLTDIIEIFGIKTKRNEIDILDNLQKNGILKIDSISSDERGFKYAIVEFAGVKFGMNKGFSFITSRKDKAAIKNIVQKISEFYSEPWIDNEDKDEPQYQYYGWNTYDPTKPSIRIRPLHSEEGGLVMFWEFPR